ncbi:MAG: zeta toxin family protein, partial [Pontiellaceae bacterium]|nr:zeta toxin family protein [Pontiellaceae bacterium]
MRNVETVKSLEREINTPKSTRRKRRAAVEEQLKNEIDADIALREVLENGGVRLAKSLKNNHGLGINDLKDVLPDLFTAGNKRHAGLVAGYTGKSESRGLPLDELVETINSAIGSEQFDENSLVEHLRKFGERAEELRGGIRKLDSEVAEEKSREASRNENPVESKQVASDDGLPDLFSGVHKLKAGETPSIQEKSSDAGTGSVKESLAPETIENPLSVAEGQAVNTEPSEAQKEAENYKKAHVRIDGMDISIENPVGSVRRGVDEDGKAWESEMRADYGYIRGTVGYDKDHVDVFIVPGYSGGGDTAFVVNQVNPKTGAFDEHKVVLGAVTADQAEKIYLSNYEPGWPGGKSVVAMPLDAFKAWVYSDAPKQGAVDEHDQSDIEFMDMVKRYEEANGTVLNTDQVKLLFRKDGYVPTNEQSVRKFHPQAATLTGRIFDYWLNSKMGTGDNTVVFLGGGNGSGKSTISGSQSIGSSFVMDSTMANLDATVSGIEKALDAGFRPEVVFVYRDPVDAWNNGVLNRVEDGEHVTPKRVFANNHSRVRQNLNALVERFGEHLNVKIFEVRSGHVPAEITLEELRSKPEYSQEKILEAINEQGNSTKNAPAEEKRQAQNGSFAEGVAGSRPATDQQAGKKNGLGGDVQGEKTPWQMTQDEYASKQGASKPEIDLFSDVSPAQAAGMSEQAIKDRASQKSKDRAEGAQKYESATADWKEAVLRSFENGEFSLLDVYSRDSKRSGHGHALYVVLSAIEESGLNVYSPFKLSQIDEVTRSEYLDELEKDYRASKAGGTPAVRSKLPAKKTLKKAAGNPAEVRTMDDEGRVSDGKGGIHPGDVFRTSSGRTTTPYPNYSTKRVTKPMERAMHQWLIDNARAEAEARGDEFNVTQFGGMNADNFPPADGAAALMYLFGEQPSVVPSVTKPLVVQNQVTEKKTVRKAESVDAKLHRDSNVPASAKAKSMLGIPDDGKISADYGYLITTKNHHFDTEEEAREAAEFVLSDPDFSTNEQHGLKGLVRKRGDGDNPKVKVNVELRGRRYHLRSIHILNDAQYERQKSRSLDMEAGASAPIPDSSAEKASKEQKGVQPTPSAGKDTTSGGNVQEQKSKKSRRNNKAKPVDAGSGEWVSPLSEVDEIRFWRELDKVRIADYVPAESLRKVGRHWSYSLINGGESPALFNAKREALEAAEKHKQLFVDMYENPTGYDSALRLRAGKSLELIRKYKNQGKSEMEAGKLAQAEIERILNEAAEPKRQQSEAGGTPAVRSKLPAKKTLKKQEPGGFVSRVDGSDGFKILEVVDTREWVETKDDKWEAVSGSGQEHQCDRCGRNHEIHFWAIDRATKKKVCLGGSCVTESGMVNKSQHRTALAAARAVARHAAEIERLEDQIEAYDQAASTVGDAPGVESRMEENRFRNGRQVKVWSIGDAELFDHELRAVLRNVERESLERQWMRNRVAEKLGVEANSAQADKRVIESKLAAAKHKKSAAERRLGLLVEAEEKAEESGIVFGPDWFKQVRVKAQDGELSLEEFMKSADYIAENEALVKEVLNGMSKPDLDKAFNVSGWRSLGEIKKPAAVKKAYDNLLGWFEMGKAPTITSYSMDYFMDAEKKAALDAKERQERLERIHSVTEEDLKVYAEKAQEALTERRKAVEAHKAALENPQTLDDFSKVIRARGFHSMTAEQVERWDQLKADEAIDERKAARAGKAQVAQIANEEAANVGMTYTEGEHSKTGATLHIVSMSARVDRDAYKELAAKAKRLGGRWAYNSKYGNSPDGFNFKSKDAADEFMALQSGNVDRSEKVENDLRSAEERAADRLLEMADKWEAEGEESMGADRQTNTAKRAREAASAVESAVNQVKQARILRNVAAAVKSGDAKYLAGIRASTHLGALQREINRAKAEWNRLNPLDEKNMDYRQIEAARSERQHRAPTLEDIRVMQYPGVHVSEQPAKDLVLKLRHITGQKQFSQQLAKGITKDGINLNLEAAERIKAALGNETPWYISDEIAHKKRLMAMGLNHGFELRMAAREYLRHYEDGPTVDPMRQKLAEIQNKKYAGFDFFPTPEKTAREIAQWLDVEPGMTVLEPSAGLGALADAVKAEQPDVQIDVVEPLNDLREVLESKGYELIGRDFEEIEPADGQYDRIIMNPPFSKNRDIKHVQRAYDLLKPGGKLAAITSAHWTFANDRESQEFREWLGEVDGWQEDLGQVFNGKDALRKTGVNSVLVKIEKPAAAGGALRERSKIGFGFYSPIERAIEGFGQETFTPEQLKAMVAKAPGVKAEELDDLGWSEFLATKGTKVTKADALEFVRGGGVQLEEVVHRAEPELTVDNLPSGYRIEQIATNGKVRLYKRGGGIDVFDTEEDALEQAKYYIGNSGAADNTKYGKYTLSGGENYREVLLTLPVKPNKNELSFNDWLEMKGYDSNAPGFDESLAQDMYAEDVPVEMHPAEFNSSHWDESNVLAHVRLNDRRGPNGEKIMLVEEIQSDWHQEGRKSGYKKTHTKLPNGWVIKPAGNTWQEKNPSTDKPFELALYDESGQLKIGFRDGYTKSEALAYAIESLNKDEDSFGSKRLRTPNAPFKKSWAMLAFKRALKLAVDEGYDAIAWTPGEAQAERYDLSKQLDEVSIRKAGGTDVLVNGLRHGRVVVTKQTPLDKLDEVVGKELAQKAAADLETSDDVSYSGLSLKVGGSGMKGFYDKILPAEVGKYVRKMGGKVGTIGIAVDRGFEMADFMEWAENRGHNTELLTAESEAKLMDEWQADKNTTEVWNLPITDQMRGVVARGQALYERLDPERLGEYLEKRGVKDVETATEQLQLQWDEAAQKDGKLYETRVAEGASGKGVEAGAADARGKLPKKRGSDDAAARALMQPDNAEALRDAFESGEPVSSVIEQFVSGETPNMDWRGTLVRNARDFAALLMPLRSPYVESVKVAYLDKHKRIISARILSVGLLDSSLIDAQQIIRNMPEGTSGVIVAHNHPSGDPTPSKDDVAITNKIRAALNVFNVPLYDHIVTNGGTYCSLRDLGYAKLKHNELLDVDSPLGDVKVRKLPPEMRSVEAWERVPRRSLKVIADDTVIEGITKALRQADGDYGHAAIVNSVNALVGIVRLPLDLSAERAAAIIMAESSKMGGNAFFLDWPVSHTVENAAFINELLELADNEMNLPLIDVATLDKRAENVVREESKIGFGSGGKKSRKKAVDTEAGSAAKDAVLDLNVVL